MHVIKTGGAVLARPDAQQTIARAWNERPEGEEWILVHGGGPQLDQALRAVQGPPKKVNGLRVTSEAGAEAVRRTMSILGADLAAGLRRAGVPAQQVSPDHQVMVAVPKTVSDGDLGRVGTVTSVRAQAIQELLDDGKLPVVTPVGWDAEGPLNVNADEGASVTAMSLGADRLVLATDVDAVLDGDGQSITALDPHQAKRLMDTGVAEGGMHAKLDQARGAIEAGVPEVRIGDIASAWDPNTGTTMAMAVEVEALA